MVKQIPQDELVAAFSQSVGIEKATTIVEGAAEAAGIEPSDEYSLQEIVRICDVIQSEFPSGFINIVASEYKVRKQADKRFYALFENIPDPALVQEFTGPDPVTRAVNDPFESVFGYNEAELVGNTINDYIVPPEERDTAIEIDQRLRSGEDVETELQRVTKGGDRRDFLFRAISIQKETGGIEAYGIYTDITEQKRRTRALEQRNRQLEEFASVVSHDLRNPLSVANANLAMVLQDFDETLTGYDKLTQVDRALDRMGELIQDLLRLARSGQRIEDPREVSLNTVATTAWATVDTADATIEFADDLTIQADPERLRQLFENLFRNAIEHALETAEESQAAHNSFWVEVGELPDARGFYVEDAGPGIPPAKRADVFEYGFSTTEGGTGMGLSIVKRIADAHEWEASVTDGSAGGARFEFANVTLGE